MRDDRTPAAAAGRPRPVPATLPALLLAALITALLSAPVVLASPAPQEPAAPEPPAAKPADVEPPPAPVTPAAADEEGVEPSDAAATEADVPAGWQSGYVTTPDGVRIHYFEAGPEGEAAAAAPSLLFVPGWTLPGQIFAPQIEHFAAGHRVVAMDPRSQGRSDHPDEGHYPEARGRDVQAVIEELGLAPVVPVCWSLAVGECVALVEQFGGDHLAGLVLVDGLAGGAWDPSTSPFMVGWVGRLMRDRESGTASFIRSMYRTPQEEAYLERVTAWSLDTPTDAMAALMVGGLTNDNRDVLDGIEVPVLMAVSRSPFLPLYEEMRDRLAAVRFEVFDAGHALFVDQPERFNALLAEFVADPAAAAAGDGPAPEAGAEAEETASGDGAAAEGGR